MAAMLRSYFDESAVDGGGPISAVGGLLLNGSQYKWLESDWNQAIADSGIGKALIHMKDFGDHGDLASFPIDEKRALLTNLARIINNRKRISIGSTLTPDQYRNHFSFLHKKEGLSIHTSCFLLAAVCQGKWCEEIGYVGDIPFMLDQGCPDRKDIEIAHAYLTNEFPAYQPDFPSHAGGLTWENDEKFPSLQAADVVAWAVRRKAAEMPFNKGTEPLLEIFDNTHFDAHFEKDWMAEIESGLRTRLER
jgi:hypothetical protein